LPKTRRRIAGIPPHGPQPEKKLPGPIDRTTTAPEIARANAQAPEADNAHAAVRWNLRRNIAMKPRVFMLHIGAAASISCAIGVGFCIAGYPLVLAFCACQALALLAAMVHYAVHALDGEQLVLTGEALEVRCTRGFRSHTVRLDPCWTRLECTAGAEPPTLCSGRTRVPVAVYLAEPQRRRFAAEFGRMLAGARMPGTVDRTPGTADCTS
jgi:uncharacterized membrane protein